MWPDGDRPSLSMCHPTARRLPRSRPNTVVCLGSEEAVSQHRTRRSHARTFARVWSPTTDRLVRPKAAATNWWMCTWKPNRSRAAYSPAAGTIVDRRTVSIGGFYDWGVRRVSFVSYNLLLGFAKLRQRLCSLNSCGVTIRLAAKYMIWWYGEVAWNSWNVFFFS